MTTPILFVKLTRKRKHESFGVGVTFLLTQVDTRQLQNPTFRVKYLVGDLRRFSRRIVLRRFSGTKRCDGLIAGAAGWRRSTLSAPAGLIR